MSALLATFLALLSVVLVHVLARAVERAGPDWMTPARSQLWAIAGVVLAAASGIASALGGSWLAYLSPRLGLAEAGAAGALAAVTLSLAALLLLTVVLHLVWPRGDSARAPARATALLFGIAPDGTALEGVRRPLRWGFTGLSLALIAALPWGGWLDVGGWATASMVLVAMSRSLARPLEAQAEATVADVVMPASEDAHAAFHRALGSPPLFEREAAVGASSDYASEIVLACLAEDARTVDVVARVLAAAAPEGAGKRRAARIVAERLAERGLATLWIGANGGDEKVGAQSISPADLNSALDRAIAFPRLGLIVVDAAVALSAEVLAGLRYGIHRLVARERLAHGSLTLLVLGVRPSVVTVARAIGAAEPIVVVPRQPLPTQPILRYLLPAPPEPRLAAEPPEDTRFVALDRPAPLARHPAARSVAREYLVPVGGPLGRRMREDRAQSLVRGRASRLLVALPGDRDVPEQRDGLARFHLRAALAEAPQEVDRLRAVFSPGLVDRELAALERAGLLRQIHGWAPTATGIVAAPRVRARLPQGSASEAAPRTLLVEPRSGRKREVAFAGVDLELFDGAITTLGTAERFEVRTGASRVLVPTHLVSATPLRTLATTLVGAPRKSRLRFRGAREVEVWEGDIEVRALHRGVRQFASDAQASGERRAYTRLLPEPMMLPALRTAARMLVFAEAGPSAAALHAMVHALREVSPCFFDNATDLGVTYTTADDAGLGRAAIVLYDAHPEGLGTCADLHDDDLEALVLAACELLECDCAAHCAKCCESTTCTDAQVSLDRREALRVLSELVVARPIPLAGGARAQVAALRRTA